MSLDVPSLTAWFGRQMTANLPVDPNRKGSCNGCGQCCKLVMKCPYLKPDNSCGNYENRPATCRRYPRTKAEQVIPSPPCGYYFEDEKKYSSPVPPVEIMCPKDAEYLWNWTPDMDEKIVRYGAGPSYFLTVTDPYGREIPMDEWMLMMGRREPPSREVLISHV